MITEKQYAFLKEEAAKLEITVSDLIRRIIDQYRLLVLIFFLGFITKAHAELLDIRDYWHMTCFPSYSMPYDVEIIKGQTLIISSHRYYHIVSATRSTPGFVVRAVDQNIGRTITAGFGPARGYVETSTGIEVCSGDL